MAGAPGPARAAGAAGASQQQHWPGTKRGFPKEAWEGGTKEVQRSFLRKTDLGLYINSLPGVLSNSCQGEDEGK